MELHLLLGQRLDTPRKLRFPGRFLDDIAALVASVGLEVITRVHKVRRARGLLEKHDQCRGQECSRPRGSVHPCPLPRAPMVFMTLAECRNIAISKTDQVLAFAKQLL